MSVNAFNRTEFYFQAYCRQLIADSWKMQSVEYFLSLKREPLDKRWPSLTVDFDWLPQDIMSSSIFYLYNQFLKLLFGLGPFHSLFLGFL